MDIEIKNAEQVKNICIDAKDNKIKRLGEQMSDLSKLISNCERYVWESTGKDAQSYIQELRKQQVNVYKICTISKDFFELIYSYAVSMENTSKATVESGSSGSFWDKVREAAKGADVSSGVAGAVAGAVVGAGESGVVAGVKGVADTVLSAATKVATGGMKGVTGWIGNSDKTSGSEKTTSSDTGKATSTSSNSGTSTGYMSAGGSSTPNVSYTINVPESTSAVADGNGSSNAGGTSSSSITNSYNGGYSGNGAMSYGSTDSHGMDSSLSSDVLGSSGSTGNSVTTAASQIFTSGKLSNVVPKLSIPNVASSVKSSSKTVPIISGSVAAGAVGLGAAAVLKKKLAKPTDTLELDVPPEVIEEAPAATIDQKLDALTLDDDFL